MSEKDEFDAQAERILPCNCASEGRLTGRHNNDCFIRRQAVAAALREQGKREAEHQMFRHQHRDCDAMGVENQRMTKANLTLVESNISLSREIADLRAENKRLKLRLKPAPYSLGAAYQAEAQKLRAERDQLKAELKSLYEEHFETSLITERDQLRAQLDECQRDKRNLIDKDVVFKTAVETEKINIDLRAQLAEAEKCRVERAIDVGKAMSADNVRFIDECPKCGATYADLFLVGTVESWWRKLLHRPYRAVICRHCKEIIDYE